MSMKAWVVAVLIVLVPACASGSAASSGVPHFDPTRTKMGEIQARGHIVIGVPSDYFPFGYVKGRRARGFTVGLGGLVAQALGVSARYVAAPASDLLRLVDSNRADLVFPMTPITQTAVAAHPFSDPYYIAHQRLLVPQGSAVQQVTDLGRSKVCSAIDPETQIPLTRLEPRVRLLSVKQASQCARPLRAGRVAAATSSDVALLALRALVRGSSLVGDRLTTEGYGVAVNACDPGLAQFVSRVFGTAKRDGDWTTLYQRWVLPATGSTYLPDPPTMTVIDAWDLFPPKPGAPSPTPAACPSP
jgi:polar amino acid transport system substrate-binding protein